MAKNNDSTNETWDAWANAIKARCPDVTAEFIRRDAREWTDLGGGAFRCCSPLRPDKSPSFQIWPDGGWLDWSTRESGDLITYVRSRDKSTFREALDTIAEYLGVPTWEQTKQARPNRNYDEETLKQHIAWQEEHRAVHECLTSIVHLCADCLGGKARDRLKTNYALTDEFIAFEKIGYVPAGLWELCEEHLPYPPELLLKTGMFTFGKESSLCQRILFPYWRDGICEYAIGREFFAGVPRNMVTIPEWDQGKYKKLPTHNDKHKYVSPTISNEVFWGEDCIRSKHRGDDALYITEGVTDAMILKMLGFNVVSPVTVSFSNKQIQRALTLARSFKRVVIINDVELSGSGEKGALRMAQILWANGIDVRIATLPLPRGGTKIDVNEYAGATLKESGERAAREAIEAVAKIAAPLPTFLVATIPEGLSHAEMEEKIRLIGGATTRMTEMQRFDLLEKILKRFPKVPKAPARKAFREAWSAEDRRQKEAKAKDEVLGDPDAPDKDAAPAAQEAVNRRRVFDEFGTYEAELNDGSRVTIANFSLDLVRVLEQEDGPDLLAVRVTGADRSVLVAEWVVPNRAWTNRRNFIESLPHVEMSSFMSDDEVTAVRLLLTGNGTGHVPHIRSVRTMGLHRAPKTGEPRFIVPAGTLCPEAGWMATPDVVFRPDGGSNLQERLPREPCNLAVADLKPLCAKALELCFGLTPDATTLTMLGWHFAVPFKPWLMERSGGGFPLLNVQGSPGSGKSSLVRRVYWPMFSGVKFGDPLSATASVFALTRDAASANAIVIAFDEVQFAEMGNAEVWFRRFLKRIYSGETETRGRQDQSVAVYRFEAAVLVAGEVSALEDPALVERFLYAELDKSWLAASPVAREAYQEAATLPLWRVAPLVWHWSLSADREAFWRAAVGTMTDALARLGIVSVGERVRHNITVWLFGLNAMASFAEFVGARLPEVNVLSALRAQLRAVLEVDFGSGIVTTRDGFDDFLADASAMAMVSRIQEGVHYRWIDQKLFLAVRLIENERAKWRLERGKRGLDRGHGALLKIAREKQQAGKTYVVETDHRAHLEDDRYVRGVLVDPALIPESLQIDPFPCKSPSGWGGSREGAGRPKTPEWLKKSSGTEGPN